MPHEDDSDQARSLEHGVGQTGEPRGRRMHQRNVDQYIGKKSWQHVHEQIEEFPQQRLCLVLLHQRVVLGIIPNKKPVQALFHSLPPPLGLPFRKESPRAHPRTTSLRSGVKGVWMEFGLTPFRLLQAVTARLKAPRRGREHVR